MSQEVKQARSEAEADWADRVTDSKVWVKKSLLIWVLVAGILTVGHTEWRQLQWGRIEEQWEPRVRRWGKPGYSYTETTPRPFVSSKVLSFKACHLNSRWWVTQGTVTEWWYRLRWQEPALVELTTYRRQTFPLHPPQKNTIKHIYKVKHIQINMHMNNIGMLTSIVLTIA